MRTAIATAPAATIATAVQIAVRVNGRARRLASHQTTHVTSSSPTTRPIAYPRSGSDRPTNQAYGKPITPAPTRARIQRGNGAAAAYAVDAEELVPRPVAELVRQPVRGQHELAVAEPPRRENDGDNEDHAEPDLPRTTQPLACRGWKSLVDHAALFAATPMLLRSTTPSGARAAMTQTLSIVVPVWNEERRLPICLRRLEEEADAAAAAAGVQLTSVVVVDDGSTDRTPAILQGFEGLPGRFRYQRFERANRGKGAAVRAGMLARRVASLR